MFIQTLRNSIQNDSLPNQASPPNHFLHQPLDLVEGQIYLSLPNMLVSVSYRVCPGRFLAEANLYIVIATFLSTFEVSKAIGDDGKEIEPQVVVNAGIVESVFTRVLRRCSSFTATSRRFIVLSVLARRNTERLSNTACKTNDENFN